MQTIYDTRRANLLALINQYGSIAELNAATGRKRQDASLSLVKSKAIGYRGKTRNMGDRLARTIEEKLHLPRGWMDAEHDGIVASDLDIPKHSGVMVHVLENWASMGDGNDSQDQDIIVGSIELASSFVKKIPHTSDNNLSIITGYGDSMSPTIEPGDKVLVDTWVREFLSGGIYVLRSCGKLFLKRVSLKLNGVPVISSDNPSIKLAEELNGESEVETVGKVIYVWHGRQI